MSGARTRAPEGMSILAILGISPFHRSPIPLTNKSVAYCSTGRQGKISLSPDESAVRLPGGRMKVPVGEELDRARLSGGMPRFRSQETPPFPLFQLQESLQERCRRHPLRITASHSPTDTGVTIAQGTYQHAPRTAHQRQLQLVHLQCVKIAIHLTASAARRGGGTPVKIVYTGGGPAATTALTAG